MGWKSRHARKPEKERFEDYLREITVVKTNRSQSTSFGVLSFGARAFRICTCASNTANDFGKIDLQNSFA